MNYIRYLNVQNILFFCKLIINIINYILQKNDDFFSFKKNINKLVFIIIIQNFSNVVKTL